MIPSLYPRFGDTDVARINLRGKLSAVKPKRIIAFLGKCTLCSIILLTMFVLFVGRLREIVKLDMSCNP